jgi:putative tricarboxylic transport membrane protein
VSRNASIGLAAAIMVVAGYAVFAAKGWQWKAALFPLVIGIPLFCLAAVELAWCLFGKAPAEAQSGDFKLSEEVPEVTARRTLLAWGWMAGFLALIALLGFPIAIAAFVFVYLKVQAKEGWLLSVAFTAIVWGAFYGVFDQLLHLPFPTGWLLGWLGLA